MSDESKTVIQTFLTDVYDVHYQNELTKGKWHRWMRGPAHDLTECRKWIREYGKPARIGDLGNGVCMVHIPGNKFKTTFRIVKMVREVIEAMTL